jgi:hypothetical protein
MADQEDLGVLLTKIAVDVADLKKGLAEGRNEMRGFKSMASEVGESVKKALAFAGISLGIYEVLAKLKEFAREALDTGAKVESLRLSAYALGENLGASAAFIDGWVERLKKVPMSAEVAWRTVIAAFKTGIPLTEIEKLSRAVANIAPLARMSMDEAMSAILRTVQTGSPLALRSLELPAKLLQQLEQQSGNDVDAMVGRFQTITDFLIQYAGTMEGVAQKTGDSYLKQLSRVSRAAEEAKTALYDNFLLPIAQAVTGEKLKGWEDLYTWINANKTRLQELGTGIGTVISRLISMVEFIGKIIALHPEWAGTLVSIWAGYKLIALAMGPLGGLAKIFTGAQTTGAALLIVLARLRLALVGLVTNPWAIVITLSIAAAAAGAAKLKERLAKPGSGAEAAGMALGEAWTPEAAAAYAQTHEEMVKGNAPPAEKKPEAKSSEADLNQGAEAIAKKQQQNLKDLMKSMGAGAEGGGKGAPQEDLFGEYLKLLDQKRQAEIQEAQSSLDLLKATNDQRRAEYEKDLAAGLLDGQTYYQRLQDLQKEETDGALALIEKRRQAQVAAYKDALADIARQELSPEMAGYRRQEEEARNRMALAQLDAEAARVKLEGEVKVTNELKRQLEVQKQFTQKVEDLEASTAWGPVEEQEAKLRQLYLEWQRAKAEALQQGVAPELLSRMDTAYGKKMDLARYGDQVSSMAATITNGLSSLVDAVTSGGQDLMQSLNGFFKSLFTEALKPGLDQLKQFLMNGFKELFGAAGASIGSAVLGVIGLIGMLATSGGSSSWSASGVQSSVTAHEAVRGIIAGETSIPIAQVGESLQDALVPTNSILEQIEENTRGLQGLQITLNIPGLEETLSQLMQEYLRNFFDTQLQLGVPA